MKRLVGVVIVGIVAWQGYLYYQHGMRSAGAEPADVVEASPKAVPQLGALPAVQFKCDGRTYCSQMSSCEEATFFLRNCPGVRMDGNNDGVPCEKQWCRR
jgi:excalibur calcium-binding domain-containing protein